jgi:hypothetical protein
MESSSTLLERRLSHLKPLFLGLYHRALQVSFLLTQPLPFFTLTLILPIAVSQASMGVFNYHPVCLIILPPTKRLGLGLVSFYLTYLTNYLRQCGFTHVHSIQANLSFFFSLDLAELNRLNQRPTGGSPSRLPFVTFWLRK